MPNSSHTYDISKALTNNAFTKTGYTFSHWNTKSDGSGTSYSNMQSVKNLTTSPGGTVTLYAQWTVNTYKITVSSSNATVTVNGTKVNNNGTISIPYGATVTVSVSYSESKNQTNTIKDKDGKTYSSPFVMPAQDIEIHASSEGCVAAGTLITLADGTVKAVEDLLETDILLVYDHITGEYVPSSIVFIESDGWDYYDVIYLEYSNGVVNRLIYEHAMFDLTLNKYVYITEQNYFDFIGHEFAYFNGESIEGVTLDNAYVKNEYTGCFSLITAVHFNCFIDGMFSIPGGAEGIFNIFEYGEDLIFDAEKMQADIETYGLFTYEDFSEYVPEEVFYAFQAQYLKVSVGKGYITFDEILAMIDKYLVRNGVI